MSSSATGHNDRETVAADPDNSQHIPVLLAEVMEALAVGPGAAAIDCTLGGGGHTAALLSQSAPTGRVLALDADPAALRRAQRRFDAEIGAGRLLLVNANFAEIQVVAAQTAFTQVDAILLDLGVSSFQLETPERGFSFLHDGPLDMRFDPAQTRSAADIVNTWDETELANLIFRYGEERRSRAIARMIVKRRPITTTAQLAETVANAVGGRRGSRLHPATQTFQALRIAVNQELEQLERTLPQCLQLLRPGGRLAVISFHSLEDRIVKQWMQFEASDWVADRLHPHGGVNKTATVRTVTKKPLVATPTEMERNPRSRSAKLRVVERMDAAEKMATLEQEE